MYLVQCRLLAVYFFSSDERSCWCSLWDVCRESVELSRLPCLFLYRKQVVESLLWVVHSSIRECLTYAVFENFKSSPVEGISSLFASLTPLPLLSRTSRVPYEKYWGSSSLPCSLRYLCCRELQRFPMRGTGGRQSALLY